MKKTYVLLTAILISVLTYAQGTAYNSTLIRVLGGETLYISGGLENSAAGTIKNKGTIEVTGDWINDNALGLNSDSGLVILSGTDDQTIGGAAKTTFHHLELSGALKTLENDISADSIALTDAVLDLNSNTLEVLGEESNDLSTTTGIIVSEKVDNSSVVKWTLNSNTEEHVFPFGRADGEYIPVKITNSSGNIGVVSVATYPTAPDNTPYPTTPQLVNNVDNSYGQNNSDNAVDRFWQIDKSGPSADASIIFTYAQDEIPSNGEETMEAQQYDNSDQWILSFAGQISDLLTNEVAVSNVTNFSPWMLVLSCPSLIPEIAGDDNICVGDAATLIASAPNSSDPTFEWYSDQAGVNLVSTGANFSTGVLDSDTTFYLRVFDGACQSGFFMHAIEIKPNGIIAFSGENTICDGESTTLTATGLDNYSWKDAQGTELTTTAELTVSPTQTTKYYLNGDKNGCLGLDSIEVVVNELPEAVVGTDRSICEEESTTLGSTTITDHSYSWTTTPTGFTSTLSEITVSPTETTSYSLTETNTLTGCFNSNEVEVTLNPLPNVSTGTDAEICDGEQTTIGESTEAGFSYSWISNPAGFTSTLSENEVSPSATTTYTLTKENIGTSCLSTSAITVTVNPLPEADAGDGSTLCQESSITLGKVEVIGNTYSWSVSDNLNNTGIAQPTYTTPENSTQSIIQEKLYLTVTSNKNCMSIDSVVISTYSNPIANAGDDIEVVCDETTNLNASATGGTGAYSYTWKNGPTTSTYEGVQEGTYIITVGDENFCFSKDTMEVTKGANPLNAQISASPSTICDGDDSRLTAILTGETGTVDFTWNEGLPSTQGPHTVIPTTTTNYIVDVVDELGCTGHAEITVNVNSKPEMELSSNSSDDNFCEGEEITITASPSDLFSYVFFLNGTETSTGVVDNTFDPGVLSVGNHTIKVIGNNGCEGETSFSITINPTPSIAVVESSIEICKEEDALLQIQSPQGANTYTWSIKGGASIGMGSSISVSPTETTVYEVVVESANSCTNVAEVEVIVKPLPVSSFTYSVDNLELSCLGTNANDVFNWIWEFGDRSATISGEKNVSHTFAQTSPFDITLIVENSCGFDTNVCTVNIDGTTYTGTNCEKLTGIYDRDQHILGASMEVYPNPYQFQTNINLEIIENGEYSLELFDVLGRKLSTTLEKQHLSNGLYVFQYDGESKGVNHFVLKQNNQVIQVKRVVQF
jgi:hypothetical protein